MSQPEFQTSGSSNARIAFTYIFTLFNISCKTTNANLPLLIYPLFIHLRNLDNKKRVLPAFNLKKKHNNTVVKCISQNERYTLWEFYIYSHKQN